MATQMEVEDVNMSAQPADPVLVGRSPRIREVVAFVRIIADSESAVLITGESGSGKDLIARLIHYSSLRRQQPFVATNCARLPETLVEAELFGHERGTLFLDDIDDLPPTMQAKLLRVLQARKLADVRVLAGSKRDLRKLVAAGAFREDLFYLLNVIPIQLPPLRDRTEDLPLLVEHFFAKYFQSRGNEQGVDGRAGDALEDDSLDARLAALETHLIVSALRAAHGNKSKAAALLKVKRSTLGDRIRKLGLEYRELEAAPEPPALTIADRPIV